MSRGMRRGQGEYVAAFVVLALLVSMAMLALEWQKMIRHTAMKAIEEIKHSRELLRVHLSKSGLEIVNSWSGTSRVLAFIYVLNSSSIPLLNSSSIKEKLFVGKGLIVEIKRRGLAMYPGERMVISYKEDPMLNALHNMVKYVCVYTEYNNIFCNFDDNYLAPSNAGSGRSGKVLLPLINGANVLNTFAVINYSNDDPVFLQLTNPSDLNVFTHAPTHLPVAILLNFTKPPRVLAQGVVYAVIRGGPKCRLVFGGVPCTFSTKYFSIEIDNRVLEPHYICIYGAWYNGISLIYPWNFVFIGCTNSKGPLLNVSNAAEYNFFIVVVDGVPILLQRTGLTTWSGDNLVEVALSIVSANGYTYGAAVATTVSLIKGFPKAVLEAHYVWKAGVYSLYGPVWGMYTNLIKLLYEYNGHIYKYYVYGPGYYLSGLLGTPYLRDIPLTLLSDLGVHLSGSAPPISNNVTVTVDGRPVQLRNFGIGYGTVVMLSTAFVHPVKYQVLLFTHRISYKGMVHVVRFPIATVSMSNMITISGEIVGPLHNVNCSLTLIVKYRGKTLRKQIYAVNSFDFNIGIPPNEYGDPSYSEMILYIKALKPVAKDPLGNEMIVTVYYGSWRAPTLPQWRAGSVR